MKGVILINITTTAHEKKDPTEKKMEVFLLNTLKTAFKMRNLTPKWAQSVIFSQNQSTFFNFQKKVG